MSSEIYYSPEVIARRREELYNNWINELRNNIQELQKQLEIRKVQLESLTKKIDVKVEVQKQESVQQQLEEWVYQEREYHESMPVFEKAYDKVKVEAIDFSDFFTEDIVRYTRLDLEEFNVRTKAQLMKKRALLTKLDDVHYGEREVHQMIDDFFGQCGVLSQEEKEEIMEYHMMLQELQMSENEKCYEDIVQDIYLVRRNYFAKKEKQYIHEQLVRVLHEEGILYEGEWKEDGIIKNEFMIDKTGDALLQVTENGSKRIMFEYVGVEDGIQSLSDEDKKRIVSKGKELCKKVNRVVERLYKEYGIQMEINYIQEPTLESIKTVQKKQINGRKQSRQEQKRMRYEV